MSFKIEVTNLKELQGKMQKMSEDAQRKLKDEMNRFADNTVTEAKRLAPVDEGLLRNSISANKVTAISKNMVVEVIVAADYAAYVEFGTRKFAAAYVATLPPEWQEFAAKYKGKGGGTFEEFVMRLARWVKRKGIGATYDIKTRRRDRVGKQSAKTTMEADAYAIALHIMRNGIKPHPFLYPAVENNKKIFIDNIKKELQ